MADSKNIATQCECICAVAIALQSWGLIKLSRGLILRNFDLALEQSAMAPACGDRQRVIEPAEYMLYSAVIAVLHHAG